MKVKDLKSQESSELNAKILRAIESMVCRYREILPDGWRCCVEFQGVEDAEPYYLLDVQSNQGGGEFAPVKMQTLKLFPSSCATGNIRPDMIRRALLPPDLLSVEVNEMLDSLASLSSSSEITEVEWKILKDLGITHWYGGIRIPYDILITDVVEPFLSGESSKQSVEESKGEIRIAFSGAKEWQDTFFCFCLFERIQGILNSLWSKDQIWYNLRGFKADPNLQFWIEALGIREAPED